MSPADDSLLGQATVEVTPWTFSERDEQVAFCTCSDDCAADVDAHDERCPVEAELRRIYGF